jgi:hypothetical protein
MGLSVEIAGVLLVLGGRAALEGPRSTRTVKVAPTILFGLEQ